MKIHLVSDLHTEFSPYLDSAPKAADVIIAAGDVAVGDIGPLILRENYGPHVPIIYVAGNHEFYRQNLMENYTKIAESAKRNRVHFLQNSFVEIDDVLFVGGTLWTDFCLYGEDKQFAAMSAAKQGINDFRLIAWEGKYQNNGNNPNYMKYEPFAPQRALEQHHVTRSLIDHVLDSQMVDGKLWRKVVVVTHMAPSLKSVHEKYAGDILNSYYASNQIAMIAKYQPTLWVHGHMHDSFDYMLGDTRVVCNPRGYVSGSGRAMDRENKSFDPNLIIEI